MALCCDFDQLIPEKWIKKEVRTTEIPVNSLSTDIGSWKETPNKIIDVPKCARKGKKNLSERSQREDVTLSLPKISWRKKLKETAGGLVDTTRVKFNKAEEKKRLNIIQRISLKRNGQKVTKNQSEQHSPIDISDNACSSMSEVLASEFPTITISERQRFSSGRSLERARYKMSRYVEWRKKYNVEPALCAVDEEIWNHAAKFAAKSLGSESNELLPRILRFGTSYDWTSKSGNRVVQVLPGLIDTGIASLEVYVLSCSLYLDLKLDRHSLEQIIVLIDVRAGKGWPNPSPTALIPFAKHLSKCLADTMPERLHLCIVYPVPSPAKVIWGIFKGFLEKKHVLKIQILWGMALATSPAPLNQMQNFFSDATIEDIEKSRLSEFRF